MTRDLRGLGRRGRGATRPHAARYPRANSMIPNRVDQLFLAHVRPAFDTDALCLVVTFLLRPILAVGAAMIERAACPGVGDSRRLLLRRAVVAPRVARSVVFYLRSKFGRASCM